MMNHAPVRHVVVFKYKPDATIAQIDEVTTAFGVLLRRTGIFDGAFVVDFTAEA